MSYFLGVDAGNIKSHAFAIPLFSPGLRNLLADLAPTCASRARMGRERFSHILFENSLLAGLGMALFFVFITFPVAVIYTWLYNGTGGSLLITSLWSTSTTLAIASAAASGIIPIIFTAFLIIIAMILANQRGSDLGRRA